AWIVLPTAFLLGAGAAGGLNLLVRRTRYARRQGEDGRRDLAFLAAITLHNIPEGMAVGLAFAAALSGGGALAAGAAAALGIGLQNLPEGAAVSLPLYQGGMSRKRSFLLGAASGAVEQVSALVMIACSAWLAQALPALMAFAAGAMMLVTLGELAPASAAARDGAIAAMLGFALMTAMDMGLG
ncbi:MAG: ZIP family metal transporter, partial [Clostridia bacterium]|nr:ZIP family metal transporter [Clostridia bacterium]